MVGLMPDTTPSRSGLWTRRLTPFIVVSLDGRQKGSEPEMIESEPWSYHADGTPVTSLADVIRKRAAATPDGVALSRAGQVTTFADIDARSSQAAAALRDAGVVAGDRVAFIGAS